MHGLNNNALNQFNLQNTQSNNIRCSLFELRLVQSRTPSAVDARRSSRSELFAYRKAQDHLIEHVASRMTGTLTRLSRARRTVLAATTSTPSTAAAVAAPAPMPPLKAKLETLEVGDGFVFLSGWVVGSDNARVVEPLSIVVDDTTFGPIPPSRVPISRPQALPRGGPGS
jgi:hypothetical protein